MPHYSEIPADTTVDSASDSSDGNSDDSAGVDSAGKRSNDHSGSGSPSGSGSLPRLFVTKLVHFTKKLVRIFIRPMRGDKGEGGVIVHPYRGYGSHSEAFIMGRVFRQPGRLVGWEQGGVASDLVDVARRVVRHGVRDARVDIRLGATHATVTTDRDGYFHAHIDITHTLPAEAIWHSVKLQVVSEDDAISAETEIYIPPASTDLIVISDIDDTVMYTGVANKLKMLYRLFMEKADRRTAFPGVSALYRALYGGAEENRKRPMLYVSRGPWAIYEVLETFFNMNNIPVGPILFLREWGMTLKRPWPRKAEDHKSDVINNMLALYDTLPFILIGDSGQRDPEVYAEIVKAHPDRVRAIYIRKVDNDPERDAAIEALAHEVREAGCELILAHDSVSMAEHALSKGYISEESCEAVREDTRQQQRQ
ncbi:App1 family protein [Salinicola halophyticus]|uniref:App1 family protein n=1 Tax=Salinicola halophyticus TaxID=1808881 RepID=UPI003F45002D